MSSLLYIASDHPLREIPNPHEKWLSINEALAMGVDVPKHLQTSGIDRDWKHAIHWSDREVHIDLDHGTVEDGDYDDDFSILPLHPTADDIYTSKIHRAAIECLWTEGRARAVLIYLRDQLKSADEVELWHIWMGCDKKPRIIRYEAQIDSFTPEDLMEIAGLPVYEKEPVHHCVTIRK